MKYSQFNSVIPYDGKFALYNSFNQKTIFLDPSLKDLLHAAVNEGVDKLEAVHPSFFRYLQDEEFLVPDQTDEIGKVKELSRQVDENHNTFLLTVNPSMNCNFKCWYCYETHIRKSRLDDEMIERINRFVTQTAAREQLTYFSLAFFGGEPLLYFRKDVTPLIDTFVEQCESRNINYSLSFTTNGYLINQDFVDYFRNKGIDCSLQITLDGYREKHDLVRYVSATKGSYEQIIRNIRLLITNRFFVRLRINYTDQNLDDTHKIADEFADVPQEIKDNYLLFDYHRVWQDDKVDDTHLMLDKNLELIRDQGMQVSGKYSPNNVRESCYADKRNSVVINYNGDLYKCTARDFETASRAGYLGEDGTLIWENDYQNKRMDVKFHNKPCQTCRIMPLCNGGCSQHALEHLDGDDYCVFFGDENEKDKVIKSKIEEALANVPA